MIEKNGHSENYNSDLGLYITKITPNAKSTSFVPFKMFNISRIGSRSYSTTSDIHHEDRQFCVTLDFNREMYIKLISIFPADIASSIKKLFQQPFRGPQMVDFPFPIEIGVAAQLGKKQTNEKEEYVPFDVTDVFPID